MLLGEKQAFTFDQVKNITFAFSAFFKLFSKRIFIVVKNIIFRVSVSVHFRKSLYSFI